MLVLCVDILSNEGVLLAGRDWETKEKQGNKRKHAGPDLVCLVGWFRGLGPNENRNY